jgi:tyrosine-protein phosphatase SIW14
VNADRISKMKPFICTLFLLLVVMPSVSAETAVFLQKNPVLPGKAKVSEKIYGLPGLSNVGRISQGIYRGNQPLPDGYKTLKKMGIKTVINLRSRHSEKKSVENNGMNYMEFPISMIKNLKRENIREIINAMADPENQPVYIHCALGRDRTGIVSAIYRIEKQGWSFDEAEQEMQDFGFNDAWINLRKLIRNYSKEEDVAEPLRH